MKDVTSSKWIVAAAGMLALYGGSVLAGSVTNTDSFTAGTAATAASVNTKFSEFGTAINDNDSRITALEQGDTDGLTLDELAGTYAVQMFEYGELIKNGADQSGGAIGNPDNFFATLYESGSYKLVFDTTGNATLHTVRRASFEQGHYTDGGSDDSSRTKESECDVATVSASSSTLDLCDTADPTAIDVSGTANDEVLPFQIIDPTMRSIGMDGFDPVSGDETKLRGNVSLDGNIISLRFIESWCGTSYDPVTQSCTGGKFIGRGIITMIKVAN